ncbi:NAD(P)H-dependent oxidoreductase [Guptibacillus hwajinpoensis]|uniref:Glutathione-regulated potassium-efflux system ancillary protein KefG n=1 Tax=Guptibacillus hwajinpoensis TaxID=208199 RepID=A0ABU0K654_9BACL|nr:NAD(P)H-dependent oxidoreductase [Alkalihalobacillus hemicentroti]MDQ0483971.1 glutathione-regulated potassium-efflux system ancillary protein KefG [Alkalihalobacillus hemicentroti]
MKTLVIIAHPNLEESNINRILASRLETKTDVTIHKLYEVYPDGNIDVEYEQALLLKYDRIVFQFPFYWYSSPSLLKEWQDKVLTYGWAYGSEGNALHGKEFMIATSTGGPETAYQAGGFNHFSMSELLKPFHATANLTGMRFLPIFTVQGVFRLTEEEISEQADAYVQHVVAAY